MTFMNRDERWLLPEGVDEILPSKARAVEQLRRRLLDLYASWGYELVFPPLIEFLESLLNGAGQDLERETYKVTDRLTGRLMGVRADITPQVARMDAHSLRQEGPVRLCYCSTALRTRPAVPGGTRAPYQVGVELFGHDGVDSDVEVISLMLATLDAADVKAPTLDLGHVGIYRALVAAAGLTETQEYALTDIYMRKARTELTDFVAGLAIGEAEAAALQALPWLTGTDAIEKAEPLLASVSEDALQALAQTKAVIERVQALHPNLHVHVDLGELRGYRYHTGCIFAVYSNGLSEAVAKGGRYNRIGEVFGRARPATGFSADLKILVNGLEVPQVLSVFAPADSDESLDAVVAQLRAQGQRVVRALSGCTSSPSELGCNQQLVLENGRWVLAPLSS